MWAWTQPADGCVDDASLADLLVRAATYDRIGDAFSPAGFVACAAGLEGLLAGGGSGRVLFSVPVLEAGGSYSRIAHGAATDAYLRAGLDAALAEPEPRAALGLIAYLVSRGRLTVGLAMPQAGKEDMRSNGHPHAAWAIARDGGAGVLLLPAAVGHRYAARDEEPAVGIAARAIDHVWTEDGSLPQSEMLPPSFLDELRGVGERTVHPARPSAVLTRPKGRSFTPGEVLRFAMLRDAPRMPGGRHVGIDSAPVAPWPHQAAVARRVVDGYPRSWLLSDEVGLGKTIEAGLAMRALMLSGTCGRTMVAAPASLTGQWQREMALKFAMRFEVAENGARERLYEPDSLIVSRSLLASTETHRTAALAAAEPWDLVVADEAHGARRGTILADVIDASVRPRCASMLMATATPMQLRARDAFDLNRWARRGGAFDGDDALAEAYYEILEGLPENSKSPNRATPAQNGLLATVLREQRGIDPAEWDRAWSNATFHVSDAVRRDVLAFVDGKAGEVQPPSFKALRQLAYAVAPLGRTMLRHGREVLRLYEGEGHALAMRLPVRVVRARALAFDARERDLVGRLDAYLTGLTKRLSGPGRKSSRGAAFYASFVRLRAASSETAAMRTFRRRLAKVETCLASAAVRSVGKTALADLGEAVLGDDDLSVEADEGVLKDRTVEDLIWEADRLRGLLVGLDARGDALTSKARALLECLEGADGRAAVVFTRFRDTVDEIVTVVREHAPSLRFGTYTGAGGAVYDSREGRMVARDREEVTAAIQAGRLDLIVCTDAAAEGLNLQRAGLMVNYDLPWNPTKVEQRIGRIDRIGQVNDEVEIVNLVYQGSAEERVYARLLARLDAIGSIVGSQQISLIPLSEGDFLTLADPDVGEPRKAALVEKAQAAAVAAARRIASREIPARHLMAAYRLEEARVHARRVPARLGDLWRAIATSPTLAALGFADREDGNLALPEGVVAGKPYMLTIDRDLHAVGMSPDGVRTAFATWGDPIVEGLFRLFDDRPLPAFARRMEVHVPVAGRDVPVVGYAVATPCGPMLFTSVDDIEACPYDRHGTVSDADVESLLPALRALARAEYADAATIAATERRSLEAARSRKRLVRGVCLALLDQRTGKGSFESEMGVIEAKVLAMREGPTAFVARVDGIVAKRSPGTFEPFPSGAPGRYRVMTDTYALRSAVALAREVRESLRKGDATEMRDVFNRILLDAREGVPVPGPRTSVAPAPPAAPPEARPAEAVTPIQPVEATVAVPETDDSAGTVPAVVPEPVADPVADEPAVPSGSAVVDACPEPSEESAVAVPDAVEPMQAEEGPSGAPTGADPASSATVPVASLPPGTRAEFLSAASDILMFGLSHGDARGYLAVAHADLASANAAVEATFSVDETLGAVLEASAPAEVIHMSFGPGGLSGDGIPGVRPCAVVLECGGDEVPTPAEAARLLRAAIAPRAESVGDQAVPGRPLPIGVTREGQDGGRLRLEHAGQALVLDAAMLPELMRMLASLGDTAK